MSSEWTSFVEPSAPEPERRPVHLAEYWKVVVKRWRLIALCVVLALGAAAIASLVSKPAYKAVAVLEVDQRAGAALTVGATGEHSGQENSEFLPTQMRLMQSREISERVVRKLGLAPAGAKTKISVRLDPVTSAAIAVQKGIQTTPVRFTNLVELSYVSSSAARAAQLANAVAEEYIEWTIEAKLRAAGNASQFLDSQIEQFKAEVAKREEELLAFRRESDVTSRTGVTTANVEALNADYAAAVRERVAKEARLHEVRNSASDALAASQADAALTQARAEQARLEREYADKLDLFKPEWPAMQQLKAQIDKGRLQLDILIQETANKVRIGAAADYQAAVRREESLKSEMRSQKTAVLNLSGAELGYNQKKLELQSKQALLDSLLKRKAEADVLAGLAGERISNVRIVDRALPPAAPFRPSYAKNGLFGFVGGILAGLGLAFFVSYLDRSLRTPEQVEEVLQLPALGAIPSVGGPGWVQSFGYSGRLLKGKGEPAGKVVDEQIELLPHRQPQSQIAECYRSLRTSLLLSRAGGIRSIVVTSGLPQEGKTATAVNLAAVLTQLGKKVLLVDADLHRPRLHEIFRVSNRTGLVSILAEEVPGGSTIAGTAIPDLFVVPSGPPCPNPSGLLSSETMSQWLDDARKAFDYVILDTPPLQLVADAILLGHQTDGAVLCVRSGQTPRERVMSARDRMLRSGIRILGVLLNGVEADAGYGEVYAYDQATVKADRLTPEKPVAAASRSL